LFVLLWCYPFYVYVLIFFYTVVELVIFVVGPTCMLKCVYLSHGAYILNTSLVFLIRLQFISRLHIVKNAKRMWSQIVLWRSISIHASI